MMPKTGKESEEYGVGPLRATIGGRERSNAQGHLENVIIPAVQGRLPKGGPKLNAKPPDGLRHSVALEYAGEISTWKVAHRDLSDSISSKSKTEALIADLSRAAARMMGSR